MRSTRGIAVAWCLFGTAAVAQDVRITEDIPSFSYTRGSTTHSIARSATPDPRMVDILSRTQIACPPNCIQPMQAAPGVETVGELEVLRFMEADVSQGRGVLVDARLEEWFAKGTIPGAISMPFPALDPNNSFLPDILRALGARDIGGTWQFDDAFDLLVFGNGPASDMAPRAIQGLISAGYPSGKIFYYRAGLQGWMQLGLTLSETAQ